MNTILIQLLLPPVVILVPWLIPALRGQWLRFGLLGGGWAFGVAITTCLWAGPGLILLTLLGLFAVVTTRIRVTS